jgi:exopolyphosphatase/guanosine-5'-triphosphate,3'-diphosphate pyrophosphatase
MNKPLAVMDLGTNTFHLLIVEGNSTHYTEIVHEQDPVKLGEGGINKGFIQPAAFERGIKSMLQYRRLIADNNVQQVRAIATSALRNAANGQDFIDQVKAQTGIAIEIIDGDAEAAYIYKGSVEFIICDNKQVKWKQSFEIGAARLMDNFHRTDPIPPESITALNLYLQDSLKDLFAAASNYPIANIIGSSGVFESYAGLIETGKGHPFDLKKTKHYDFEKDELLAVIESLILSSHQQRAGNKGIIPVRVDMIVTASILTRFIIDKLGIDQVVMSTSSLKEGVLAEMMG